MAFKRELTAKVAIVETLTEGPDGATAGPQTRVITTTRAFSAKGATPDALAMAIRNHLDALPRR